MASFSLVKTSLLRKTKSNNFQIKFNDILKAKLMFDASDARCLTTGLKSRDFLY